MRTTLIIDDHVHAAAKKKAIELGIPLTRFIEEAIRLRIAQSKPLTKRVLKPLPTFGGLGLRPGLDFDDMDTIYEAMDRETPLDQLR
jgi:hypothetical protein